MNLLKAAACLFLLIFLVQKNNAQGHFEDVDRENDFVSRFSDISQHWDIRHNIPGEPDIDYPIYSVVPRTSFTCDNRHEGYYADVEARCQAFRICANTDITGEGFAFLCPNGTLFSQRNFVCDWYRNVNCSESEDYYFMNKELGKVIRSKEEMLEAVKHMIEFPIRSATKALSETTPSFRHTTVRPITKPTVGRVTTFKPLVPFTGPTKTTPEIDRKPTRPQLNIQRPAEPTPLENMIRKQNNANGDTKDSRSTTRIPITKEEAESTDLSKLVPPGKVYVSNLGELSTDRGSTFDPQTSLIIGEGAQKEEAQDSFELDVRSSFDDKPEHEQPIPAAEQRNEHFRQNTENIRNSLPASINDLFGSPDTFESSQVIQSKPQHKQVTPSPTPSPLPTPQTLTLAEKINTELNGIAKVSIAGDKPLLTNNNIYSGEGSLITHSFSSPEKPHSHERLYNLANNINSVFQTNSLVSQRSNNFQQIDTNFPSRNHRVLGQGFSTQNNRLYSQTDDFRRGRQFQFQGRGFSKIPAQDQQIGKTYLPPTANQGYRNDDRSIETANTETATNNFDTAPNLLINVQDFDGDEGTKSDHFGENYVHVKKRAERLLLQGVHVTLYENDESDIYDNNIAENVLSRSEINPSTSTTTPTPTTTTTEKLTTTESITIPPTVAAISPTVATNNITLTTTPQFLQDEIVLTVQTPAIKEFENSSAKYSLSMNIRRQTAKPINYTKKPLITRNITRTLNTEQGNKYRRRPTNRFSSKYSINSSTTATDVTEENDLTPQANSYGVRPSFNRIKNETNKYTLLKRTKINYGNRANLYSPRNKFRPTASNLNITTSSPPTTTTTLNYDSNLQGPLHVEADTKGSTSNKNNENGQGFAIDNLKALFPFQQQQQLDNSKKSSSYVELPGTKVTIAKSQEQGHFTISNDPAFRSQQNAQISGSNGYQPLEQFLQNNFLGHQNQQGQTHQQTAQHQQQQQHSYYQQSNQKQQYQQSQSYQQPQQQAHQHSPQQQSTNFFLPFPTIATTKKPTQSFGFHAIPSISHEVSSNLGQIHVTTPRPYIPPPSKTYYQSQSNGYSYISGPGDSQFSPFPVLEGIPISQRRLDLVEDEKEEGSLYTGVSSYNVPINSVGRLPGDTIALRKRRYSF